jgi:phage shock protein C
LAAFPKTWRACTGTSFAGERRSLAKLLEKRRFAILGTARAEEFGEFAQRSSRMDNTQPSLLAREDTLLGICEGLGEDFGFNPLYLRLVLALLVLVYPAAAIGAYLGGGALVVLTRWFVPNPRIEIPREPEAVKEPANAEAEADQFPLPLAA